MTGKTKRGKILNLWLYSSFLAIIQFAGAEFANSQIDGNAVLVEADSFRAPIDENFVIESIAQDSEGKVELTVHTNGPSKGLVKFTNPPDFAGRAILYVDENMWIYVPGTRRPLRISPAQRLLGGASNADISRTAFALDYNVNSAAEVDNSIKLELEAKNKKVAYARINYFVSSDDYRPLSAEFYAKSGNRLLKTMYFEDYKEILGKQRPMRSRIVSHIENDNETIIQYIDMRIEDTPEAWFQPSYLGRL